MLQKLKFIYLHHFKLVAILNFSYTIFFTYLFVIKGFDKVDLFNIAIVLKLIAYTLTIVIEKLFFSNRVFYYKNLGLSYRRVLGTYFGLDFIIFLLLLLIFSLWMNFI